MTETLTVGQLLGGVESAVVAAFPGPVWIRGEISGFKRTNRNAGFFKLVDPDSHDRSIEVAVRGRVLARIDIELASAGVGSLRSGIEVRLEGMVGMRRGSSLVQVNLMQVDPEFIAGKLAVDREEVLRRLGVERLLDVNSSLPMPLVPLRVGLITSRGSAAHADFLEHLAASKLRFRVSTVEAMMQGEASADQVIRALERLQREALDVVVIVRGGGSKLDLSSFDDEKLGRAIAAMPIPVITGIGHETDRSIADEVAAVSAKTPTAAAGWLVERVSEYGWRIEKAREAIRDESSKAVARASANLGHLLAQFASSREVLRRQEDRLAHMSEDIREGARSGLRRQRDIVDSYSELISTMGLERTLRRGFAVVNRPDGTPVREAGSLESGDMVGVRFSDGSVPMVVSDDE